MKYHVVLEKQEEGGFLVYIPELPGCHTQGETREEALQNIIEAKNLYLDVIKEKHRTNSTNVEVITLPS